MIFSPLSPPSLLLGRKRRHQGVYYISPKSLTITFSYSLIQQPWGLLLDGSLSKASIRFNRLLYSTIGEILWIIIGDIPQFIGHYIICLISLDPCVLGQVQTNIFQNAYFFLDNVSTCTTSTTLETGQVHQKTSLFYFQCISIKTTIGTLLNEGKLIAD